jgi:hypothetical protein
LLLSFIATDDNTQTIHQEHQSHVEEVVSEMLINDQEADVVNEAPESSEMIQTTFADNQEAGVVDESPKTPESCRRSSRISSPILLPKSVPYIKTASVITASPLRRVIFSAQNEIPSSKQPVSKRKREYYEEADQENHAPLNDIEIISKIKKIRLPDGSASGLKNYQAEHIVHQSWLGRAFSRLRQKVLPDFQ